MRHCVAVWLFCFLASILAFGQDVPRAEVFVGYSYINADTNGLSSRLNMNGADVSFVANFNQWAGAERNFSTYYKHLNIGGTGVSVRDFNIVFGPRLRYKWASVHALAGLDDFGGSALGGSSTNGAFGAAIGGGVVFKISRRIGLEGGGDYLVTRHNLLLGSAVTQNHVRAIAGVVFTFGSVGASVEQVAQSTPAPARSQRIAPRAAGAGVSIPALGIRAVAGDSQGATIASEESNGVAALAGFREGDVINSVDGMPVKSPAKLAAALSELASGAKVRLGRMVHGEWQTETVIILP
jgi:hypothetical protein